MLIYQKINFIKNNYTRIKISIQGIWEIFMYKIFVYGTLKSEYLQNKLLGHTLESYDARLEGYSINTGEKYFNVVPNEGGCVKGKVLLVNKEDMFYIDQWEVIPMYIKAKVRVHSEYGYEDAFIYIKKDKEEKIHLQDDVSNMCNNENLEATIDEFADVRDMEFPVCDLYLNYPIEDLNNLSKNKDIFTEKVKEVVTDKEFSFIGYEYLSYKYGENQVTVRVSLYIIENNEKATLSVMLPVSTCNPAKFWEKAFTRELEIEGRNFADYIYSKYNLKVLDAPKFIIYSSGEIDESKRLDVFSVEKVFNKAFDISKAVNTDISKNKDVKVYLSDNVKIEIPKNFEVCYTDRLKSVMLTLSV